MNAETAEKVAFLALHGAEPRIIDANTNWRIVLSPKVLAFLPNSARWFRSTCPSYLGGITYTPATWDDIAQDMASLPWPMIHEFVS
jgi:hypothetical protein